MDLPALRQQLRTLQQLLQHVQQGDASVSNYLSLHVPIMQSKAAEQLEVLGTVHATERPCIFQTTIQPSDSKSLNSIAPQSVSYTVGQQVYHNQHDLLISNSPFSGEELNMLLEWYTNYYNELQSFTDYQFASCEYIIYFQPIRNIERAYSHMKLLQLLYRLDSKDDELDGPRNLVQLVWLRRSSRESRKAQLKHQTLF